MRMLSNAFVGVAIATLLPGIGQAEASRVPEFEKCVRDNTAYFFWQLKDRQDVRINKAVAAASENCTHITPVSDSEELKAATKVAAYFAAHPSELTDGEDESAPSGIPSDVPQRAANFERCMIKQANVYLEDGAPSIMAALDPADKICEGRHGTFSVSDMKPIVERLKRKLSLSHPDIPMTSYDD